MISTQERFARAAARLEGVPFVEHGRDPKVGLDCVGLVLVPAKKVGVRFEDRPYVTVPGSDYWTTMVATIETLADAVDGAKGDASKWERGDILGIRFGPMKNHLSVYLGGGLMIHAYDATAIRRVVVTPMDPALVRCVNAAWRLR